MAKSANQKLKLLLLMDILYQQTDETHTLTVADMIALLASSGIHAERKSIYDDLEVLRSYGVDIVHTKTKTNNYYVGSRMFQFTELKLLVDLVQASKFITQKKSEELVKKLEQLCSVHQARRLSRQVYVATRVKSMNESIYYNVDMIHGAIHDEKQISFQYFEYTISKERRLRKNGERYLVSPYALLWSDENYYMVAYDISRCKIRHFRVDKLASLETTDLPRQGQEVFSSMDLTRYPSCIFSMFDGKEEIITIALKNHLIDMVIDRFGKDVPISRSGPEHFIVTARIAVSSNFFAWIFSFGAEARILSPRWVCDKMLQKTTEVTMLYQEKNYNFG